MFLFSITTKEYSNSSLNFNRVVERFYMRTAPFGDANPELSETPVSSNYANTGGLCFTVIWVTHMRNGVKIDLLFIDNARCAPAFD